MVVIINFHSLILYKKRNSKKKHVTGEEAKASLIFLNIYYIFGLVSVCSGNNIFT